MTIDRKELQSLIDHAARRFREVIQPAARDEDLQEAVSDLAEDMSRLISRMSELERDKNTASADSIRSAIEHMSILEKSHRQLEAWVSQRLVDSAPPNDKQMEKLAEESVREELYDHFKAIENCLRKHQVIGGREKLCEDLMRHIFGAEPQDYMPGWKREELELP